MKVGGNSDRPDSNKALDIANQDGLRSKNTQAAELAKKIKLQTEGAVVQQFVSGNPQDQIDVSLAKSISDELNPEVLNAERRAKIESLKKKIAEGTYNPSSQAVAQSLSEEIMFEIFTSGGSQTTPEEL